MVTLCPASPHSTRMKTRYKGLAKRAALRHMRASSRPVDPFRDRLSSLARVAQLVEQRIENPRVGGSNPPPGTTAILDFAPRRKRPRFGMADQLAEEGADRAALARGPFGAEAGGPVGAFGEQFPIFQPIRGGPIGRCESGSGRGERGQGDCRDAGAASALCPPSVRRCATTVRFGAAHGLRLAVLRGRVIEHIDRHHRPRGAGREQRRLIGQPQIAAQPQDAWYGHASDRSPGGIRQTKVATAVPMHSCHGKASLPSHSGSPSNAPM